MIRFRRPGARAVVALLAGATLAVGAAGTPVAAAPSDSAGRFIITVADAYDSRVVAGDHRRKGADVDFVYTAALNGFAGEMSQAELGELQRDRRVTRIERDGIATASDTQSDATWGLDRIDARSGLDKTYSYATTGTGVTAYIIDTGIHLTHSEFVGRAVSGTDTIDGGSADDCDGHGTHVAGTVGGTTYGVAKAVSLVAVRVLDCNGSGTWSGVIAGVDWVATHHSKPAVANMSLGGGANSSVDDAVANASAAGVTMVVAAGNGDRLGRQQNACNYSPARVPEAVTIGATTSTDAKTSWSNYGSCVDFFAPGASITSAWFTSDTDTNTISGTSMAAPHVAGVAALYLQGAPGAAPLTVRTALYDATTKGIVTSSSTANNHLLYSLLDAAPTDPEPEQNAPPTARFTHTCTGLTCSFDGGGSSDSDGTVASYAWDFGDDRTAAGATPSHTFAAGGTYTVALVVTDDDGATGRAAQQVTVSSSQTSGISLTASGYKVKSAKKVDLTWSGTKAASIDVYRNGTRVTTTANDGGYTDAIPAKGGGSYTYRVCEAGTATCSSNVTVTF